MPLERFLDLGRAPSVPGLFNMTRLALNGTRHVNAVSRIHGGVSARLCADHWPEIRPEENPVGFVTNGMHVPTFLHQTWADLFDQALAPRLARAPARSGVLATPSSSCRTSSTGRPRSP